MNAQQISCFLAVAETLSFSAAARKLYLTQPTVSYQIKSLERELGCRLFVRSTASTELTEAGKRLVAPAGRILAAFQEIDRAVRQEQDARPSIRMLVPPTMILMEERKVFQPLIRAVEEACGTQVNCYPIDTTPTEAVESVARGEAELLIAEQSAARRFASKLRIQPLFVSSQYIILRKDHPLSGLGVIRPGDLAGETVLLSNEDNCYSPAMREVCTRHCPGIEWRSMASYRLTLTYAAMGEGVCLSSLRFPVGENLTIKPFESGEPQNICLIGAKSMRLSLWEGAARAVTEVFANYDDRTAR